jgi:hypothetical protein
MVAKKGKGKLRVLRGGRKSAPPPPPVTPPSKPEHQPLWSICYSVRHGGLVIPDWDHKTVASDESPTAEAAIRYARRIARFAFRGLEHEVEIHSLRAIDEAEFDRYERELVKEIGRISQQLETESKIRRAASRRRNLPSSKASVPPS